VPPRFSQDPSLDWRGVAASVVRVLEEDPDLCDALSDAERPLAEQHLVAAEVRVAVGQWDLEHPLGRTPGDLGFLVLDGLLTRDTRIGRHETAELLGKGDLLRPWEQAEGEGGPISWSAGWRVLEPTRLAVLDARFGALAGRFPTVTACLVSRVMRRSRLIGLMLAVSAMPRLDERLVTLLWALADRWGRVGPEGTTVPLPLTHAMLARLVGAQRPSVTSTLKTLEERGFLARATTGPGWVLLGDPPGDPEQALAAPAAPSA
jgi:CRP/FNR family transcriptional regulator, cyclic AMP receptor protein